MREIKFRAWSKETKAMVCPDYIDCEGNCFDYDRYSGIYSEDDYILMQFTGLLDKNGKEIYEEDIVKIMAYPSGDEVERRPMIGRVQWSNLHCIGGMDISLWHEKEWWAYGSIDRSTIEVIGNIYESPELLDKD